ncbi:reprolysin-like metallopeptidase [Flavobacterium sp.]|uniref:reprolysin-like metallopeptidase n=1 Tax=Flavobacterium sp. TaxID=239 RepID=UPI00375265E2
MKKQLLLVFASLFMLSQVQGQTKNVWSAFEGANNKIVTDKAVGRIAYPKEYKLFSLKIDPLRDQLFSIVGATAKRQATIISLPNADGQIEEFEVYEASNFDDELQARFPEIRAYSGKGITDKYATLKLSIAPNGIQTMVFRTEKENEFMEPYSQDHTVYSVYKSQRDKGKLNWTCGTIDEPIVNGLDMAVENTQKINDGKLRVMRLAQSCNAEYSNYFGATSSAQVALVLAAFNATLTRCNGVYEKDLALHLNLVASSTNVIYYAPASDPYTTLANWNTQLQQALNTTLTGVATPLATNNAAYDIGHMFGASGGGGNAGCIGCPCVDGIAAGTGSTKGRGITSPADAIPQGDNFDIDYVVHEIGHQLGGNHTFSMQESNAVNFEVGSGVTIMGYAGITGVDVEAHSVDTYHAGSIAQIQTVLVGKTCPVSTNLTGRNATPVANAGLDYSIPEQTPFELRGSATDANAGDALTYLWEEFDDAATVTAANSVAFATKTDGPNWRTWSVTTTPNRLCPTLASFMANSQFTTAVGTNDATAIKTEYLNSNARTMTFRLTVRDNSPYVSTVGSEKVGQTAFDDMIVSVQNNGTPFTVSSQNAAGITYLGLSTQTVTWVVAGTNLAPYNAANVKIMLSTDNGVTWGYVLLATTPNDGTETVTIPDGVTSADCRIRVEAIGNIFLNVNTTKFTINPSLGTAAFEFQDFGLFPNPNKGNFNLRFTSASTNDIKVNVHDMRGRQVYEKSFSNTGAFNQNINLNKVEAGIYLVTIADGAKKTVKRIVVE